MSGFLDRLAARAVGEAPLIHPRIRARFEPAAAAAPGAPPAEPPIEETEERVEREKRAVAPPAAPAPPTFEPAPRSLPTAHSAEPPPVFREERGEVRGEPPERAEPRRAHVGPREEERRASIAAPARQRPAAPETRAASPLPRVRREGSTDGTEERVGKVRLGGPEPEERAQAVDHPAEPMRAEPELSRLAPAAPAVAAFAALQPLLRSPLRPSPAQDLPTVEADRRAPPPPSFNEESEPSETVVHVSIGRIDVRAAQPTAPERRPSRPAGPRLTLGDYLKGREERRR